jgi:hypothetical protein
MGKFNSYSNGKAWIPIRFRVEVQCLDPDLL